MDKRNKVVQDVLMERDVQESKWSAEHDSQLTAFEWVARLTKHAGIALVEPMSPDNFRRQMVRVAAIAVAAVEAVDSANKG